MTPAPRTLLARMEEHLTVVFHCALVVASAAFGAMLLAPLEHGDAMLMLAWLAMAAAVVCLAGRLMVVAVEDGVSAARDRPRR